MYISWLGDSAAVLSRKGEFVKLMEPHKPVRMKELVGLYTCLCVCFLMCMKFAPRQTV